MPVERASKNIFDDLGFSPAESRSLGMRASLMIAIEKRLRSSVRTQREMGALLGVAQSRVSDLLQGKIDRFSLDMLVTLAERAGVPVAIVAGGLPALEGDYHRTVSDTAIRSGIVRLALEEGSTMAPRAITTEATTGTPHGRIIRPLRTADEQELLAA